MDRAGFQRGPSWGLVVVLVPLVMGCGFIFGGTRETITANSSPDAATITTSPGTGTFTTPAALELGRKNNYSLTFEKPGYDPAILQLRRSLRGGIVMLDIILTNLVGVIVDAATGGWYKLEPKTAQVTLQRADDSVDGPETIDISVSVSRDGEHAVTVAAGDSVTVRVEKDRR